MTGGLRLLRTLLLGAVVAATLPLLANGAAYANDDDEQIRQFYSDSCLDVRLEDGAKSAGAHVQVWSCTGSDQQRWVLNWTGRYASDGTRLYQIISDNSGKCLISPNHNVVQANCSPSELWQFHYHELYQHTRGYQLEDVLTHKCLTMSSINNGTFLSETPCLADPTKMSSLSNRWPQFFWVDANLLHGGPLT